MVPTALEKMFVVHIVETMMIKKVVHLSEHTVFNP